MKAFATTLLGVLGAIVSTAYLVALVSSHHRHSVAPLEVRGSPAPSAETFDWRSIDPANTLPGRYGDFAAAAPDGHAHVVYEFSERQRFDSLQHNYEFPVPDPWYRIKRMRVEWSDDGIAWTPAGESVLDEATGNAITDLRKAGAHSLWRIVVVDSGAHELALFGKLRFTPQTTWQYRGPIDGSLLVGVVSRLSARYPRETANAQRDHIVFRATSHCCIRVGLHAREGPSHGLDGLV